jgi:hypothetical protein
MTIYTPIDKTPKAKLEALVELSPKRDLRLADNEIQVSEVKYTET